ncbi:hypothetical protein ES319_A08G054200v1 [Gossypium barbadense]|uniref:Secreted protein n=2 Tax=Gossypium TaxID=3633 RepID=A0A5J5UMT1_GOSBA|nr:hypothetical protein ES319_A08G054200v1 [Gossypium barbadense]TYI13447.1 hypothetical protein ES332_A08G059400v1 [Gossypium tomentosum]
MGNFLSIFSPCKLFMLFFFSQVFPGILCTRDVPQVASRRLGGRNESMNSAASQEIQTYQATKLSGESVLEEAT